jgi:hypothetical protein
MGACLVVVLVAAKRPTETSVPSVERRRGGGRAGVGTREKRDDARAHEERAGERKSKGDENARRGASVECESETMRRKGLCGPA